MTIYNHRGELIRATEERATPENPSFDLSSPEAWDMLTGGVQSSSGMRVNSRTSLSVSAVYRGVNLVSTALAKLPLVVFRRKSIEESETEGWEPDRNHPAWYLLKRQPNPEMNAFTFKRVITGHAMLRGNGYAVIIRDPVTYEPTELRLLDPDRTFSLRENGTLKYITTLGGTLEELGQKDGVMPIKLAAEDVLHIRGFSDDGITGISLIEVMSESLGLAMAQERFSAKFFSNSATPKVVIEVPTKLSDKAFKNLKDSWEQLYQGLNNSHRTALLEEGAKAHALSISARDAQLIESRKFDFVIIANFIGVPPHKVGHDGRTAYASLEEENKAFLDDGVGDWVCNWRGECEMKLLTEREKRTESHQIDFVTGALLRMNSSQRSSYYNTALGGRPFMSLNEVRKLENMNPVPGGDDISEPLNMTAGQKQAKPTDEKPKEDPPKKEEPADDEDTRAQFRRLLKEAMGRAAARMAAKARKAAKDPDTFRDWLRSGIFEDTDHCAEILSAPVAVCRAGIAYHYTPEQVVAALQADLRKRCSSLSDPDQLTQAIADFETEVKP